MFAILSVNYWFNVCLMLCNFLEFSQLHNMLEIYHSGLETLIYKNSMHVDHC